MGTPGLTGAGTGTRGATATRTGRHALHTDLHIGGHATATDARFPVCDPATGTVIAEVADGTADDAVRAVAAAHEAGTRWAATSPRRRSELLLAAFGLLQDRAEELAALITRESGKALSDARAEVRYAAEFFRWYAEEAVRAAGSLVPAPAGGHRILVQHRPVGVCALVTPWNFPAAMATRKLAPALAAGCTAVLKPASDAPLTALCVAALLERAGVPPGVVNVVPSRRPGEVVGALLRDPRVRKLSFTGSTEVGRLLLREAAEGVLNVSMELGGNAPFLVFADADLDAAVAGAVLAKTRNAGQACTAANRFYVQAPVAGEFGRRLATRMAALTVGPGHAEGTDIGPLINAAAVAKADRLVASAVASGARALTGGARPSGPGCFYPPTVLADVPPGAPILAEEIFAPVAPIVPFDREEEAVRHANATDMGLVSYVYTGDLARALRLTGLLEAGMVGVNRGLVSEPAAPFGGVKQSGIGREGGHDGLLDYLETQYTAVDW
ncbi:Glutarate-semialdehyde dehydrogenase DavD (plasmid) [Streptomyces sp. YIM 121038]|uniref:NAD-dependent succinate-semialdehyde dehydrogenase n=1 Tax=Streptomyces sp. YIM 121038 TaxID=2136401 RepID=UPI001110C1D5|nr:NAD-dependent succinate-semialdehyde dehydrogenase [Streptomyces sp. YIM 121038]QCX82761.1 Glutarate-semialdehyde dehydrogenase DavD [Streptomyces sp. YIM 121038]